jgi:hypothetical protein
MDLKFLLHSCGKYYLKIYFPRYDLTVPFARYCAMNKVTNIKRYQIAKAGYLLNLPNISVRKS